MRFNFNNLLFTVAVLIGNSELGFTMDPFKRDLQPLVEQLAFMPSEESEESLFAGLSPQMARLIKELTSDDATDIKEIGGDTVVRSWSGPGGSVACYVSASDGKDLRDSMLAYLTQVHSVPFSLYATSDLGLGDCCFTIANDKIVFAKGNLGFAVVVRDDFDQTKHVAKTLSKAVEDEPTTSKETLVKLRPKFTKTELSNEKASLGEEVTAIFSGTSDDSTVKLTIRYDQQRLECTFLDKGKAEFKAIAGGKALVRGFVINEKTLISAKKDLQISIQDEPSAVDAGDDVSGE